MSVSKGVSSSEKARLPRTKRLAPSAPNAMSLLFIRQLIRSVAAALSFDRCRFTSAIPFIKLGSFPFYIYPAAKATTKQFKLSFQALRLSRIADGAYWAGRGLNNMSLTLGDASIPVFTAVKITGTAGLAIPGALSVLGAVGLPARIAQFVRVRGELTKLNRSVAELEKEDSFSRRAQVLDSLVHPKIEFKKSEREVKLLRYQFTQNRFSNAKRKSQLENRIKELDDLLQLESISKALEDVGEEKLAEKLRGIKYLSQADALREVKEEINDKEIQEEIDSCLNKLKSASDEVARIARSEMHRIMAFALLLTLVSALSIASAVLARYGPRFRVQATSIGLGASALVLLYTGFDRVSQKNFYKIYSIFHRQHRLV